MTTCCSLGKALPNLATPLGVVLLLLLRSADSAGEFEQIFM